MCKGFECTNPRVGSQCACTQRQGLPDVVWLLLVFFVQGIDYLSKGTRRVFCNGFLFVSAFAAADVCHVCYAAACAEFQVSPDEKFEEIVGVSDTFVPAANVWVGEYPYLEKASETCAEESWGTQEHGWDGMLRR